MKIVHFVNGLNRGGVENVVAQLSTRMARTGYEVHIICLYKDLNEMSNDLSKEVYIHYLPFNSNKNPYIQYIWHLPILVKLLRRIKPDIIHAHIYSFSYLFLAIAILLSAIKSKNIRTIHFSGFFLERKNIGEKVRFFFDHVASRLLNTTIISVSNTVKNIVQPLYKKNKHYTIINGIDTLWKFSPKKIEKMQLGIPESKTIAVYVSRICQGKNHETLMRAWEIVSNKHKSALLLLIGDGPLLKHYQSLVKEKKMENTILFTGSISNVEDYLSVADIGIFPSESEGLGLALLEMMAMELPIIASKIPACKEIIEEKNGILYETFNEEDLANKVLSLFANKELMGKLGKNARNCVQKNYSIDKMISVHHDLYTQILLKETSNAPSNKQNNK